MQKKIRVRFAPSPTGGLHIGGVRTVLYNYLFARQQGGDFVLRIEDTDQSRFIEGAEDYIYKALAWCGLEPDESPKKGGPFAPYRQSERKPIYKKYAETLIEKGMAYYAFDTPEELEIMRSRFRTDENPAVQYGQLVRMQMINSLTLTKSEVDALLTKETAYVIRIKIPENETVSFTDMIRGDVIFETALLDDKVLLKADGMPTYHLAVVVDDYLMQITHAFRGEEWLPSAPVHVLLWQYLFGKESMPFWAHLPLILGPEGKLSKRDGAKFGFPVFAIDWKDPKTNDLTRGFREQGFLPAAFINMLAMLGWNDGTEQEIFSLGELVQKFSIEKVHKNGAKFDYEKAKWYNHEWIKKTDVASLKSEVKNRFQEKGLIIKDDKQFEKILGLVKDRCTLLSDFYKQTYFFFNRPEEYDIISVKPKWNEAKFSFFESLCIELETIPEWTSAFIENALKNLAIIGNLKSGDLQQPFRIMLVGGKFGPPVFDIAEVLGKSETIQRVKNFLVAINN